LTSPVVQITTWPYYHLETCWLKFIDLTCGSNDHMTFITVWRPAELNSLTSPVVQMTTWPYYHLENCWLKFIDLTYSSNDHMTLLLKVSPLLYMCFRAIWYIKLSHLNMSAFDRLLMVCHSFHICLLMLWKES
jgi:hypothetical protein